MGGSNNKANAWIAATVVVALLILGAGWLLAVSPKLTEASGARDEAIQVDGLNDAMRVRNAALKQQFDQLEDFKTQIRQLRVGIPTEAQYASWIAAIETAATANSVFITDTVMTAPTSVDTSPAAIASPQPTHAEAEAAAVAEAAAAAVEDANTATAEEEPADDATPTDTELPAADPAAPLLDGLYALPMSVTVQGTYPNVRAFMAAIQTGIDRLVLVTSFAATSLIESDLSAGMPPVATGDVMLSISGMAFVLLDPNTPVADDVEVPPLPTGTGVNPFMPVSGSVPTEGDAQPEE